MVFCDFCLLVFVCFGWGVWFFVVFWWFVWVFWGYLDMWILEEGGGVLISFVFVEGYGWLWFKILG